MVKGALRKMRPNMAKRCVKCFLKKSCSRFAAEIRQGKRAAGVYAGGGGNPPSPTLAVRDTREWHATNNEGKGRTTNGWKMTKNGSFIFKRLLELEWVIFDCF